MELFLYITKEEFQELLDDLNIASDKKRNSADDKKQIKLLRRSVGDMESSLAERFVVPLKSSGGGPFKSAPDYAKEKVHNTLVSKIRQNIGSDLQKNITIDSTERFIDLKKTDYNGHIKNLLNPKIPFGFKLQTFATDGALEPVQSVAVARADNRRATFFDDNEEFL